MSIVTRTEIRKGEVVKYLHLNNTYVNRVSVQKVSLERSPTYTAINLKDLDEPTEIVIFLDSETARNLATRILNELDQNKEL